MKTFKKLLSVLIALILVLPALSFNSFAANGSWTFIDGENITRQVNTAIIYRNIPESGQTRWGLNLVINAEGAVTEIFAGGNAAGENLKIPEGGAVISASGIRLGWFDENVKVGSKLYYDGYTQKLFLCDANGKFDPFFTENTTVRGEGKSFLINDPSVQGTPPYTYDIAVNSDGVIIDRGSNVTAPENGFTVSAATEDDRNFLIMYAPLGAKCSIKEGVATFTYSTAMLKNTVKLVFEKEKAKADAVSETARNIDYEKLGSVIDAAERRLNENWDYKKVIDFVLTLEKDVEDICSEPYFGELRAAFHTPVETESYDIYTTVKKAKDAGLNTLILRVSNGYNTIVPMPEESRFSQNPIFNGLDVIDTYLKACKQEGISLSLCFDVYYNSNASSAAKEWLTAPNGTVKGLSDKYFSPASEDFKAYYLEYIEYILSEYDGIKSVMFDYLRYPKFHEDCDIGYDYQSMQLFSEQEGLLLADVQAIKTELFNSPLWSRWNKFRTGLVSDMAKSISETVRNVRPDVTMTVVSARDTVDYYYMQDSLDWIDNGLFDGLCLAFHESDSDENDAISELAFGDGIIAEKSQVFKAFTGKRAFFFTGLESSKKLTTDMLGSLITESRESGADGFIFSDLNRFVEQNYYVSLSKNVLKSSSVSPFGNKDEIIKKILEYSKEKINGNMLASEIYEEKSANAACAEISKALVLIDEESFGKDEASELRQNVSVIFAASAAKNSIVKDFDVIEKIVTLSKAELVKENDEKEDENEPDESVEGEVSEEESETNSENGAENKQGGLLGIELDLDFAYVLIYGFVGLALIAAIIGMVVTFKRRGKKPPKHHMPKASKNEDNDIEN